MPTAGAAPDTKRLSKASRKRGPATVFGGVCCPCCKADLRPSKLRDGVQRCDSCKIEFDAYAFTPVVDPGPVIVPLATDGTGTPCAQHARNVAESSCGRCGAFMCALCRIDSDGQSFCPGCFERLSNEGALASSRSVYRDYGRLSTHILLVGFLMAPLLALSGPMATWFGVVGLRKRASTGDRISRLRCWIGIICGLIEMVLGIAYLMFLIGGLTGKYH